MQLTLSSYIEEIHNKHLTPQEVIDAYLANIQSKNPELNAVVRLLPLSEECTKHKAILPLAGAPVLIKDNILIKDAVTSCASRMLQDYIAPYTASCITKLEAAGALLLGQTNMDEFAMGGSNESSTFGPCINPHGKNRIPGWSSWGSAVAVAADMAVAALGTDTGGSVRQPASMCGIVGFKPSYGAISRYGVVAMASSLDQVGIFTKTVADSQLLFSFLAGYDPKDSTSAPEADHVGSILEENPQGAKFFVPEEAIKEGLDPQIKSLFLKKVEALRAAGYEVDIAPLPLLTQSLAIYYTLMPSEVSTNLSRFDGIRFGQQGESHAYPSLDAYYAAMRTQGFGEEVKRRILIWTFVLSSSNYESYYLKALHAQDQLKAELNQLFEHYAAILTPTTPEAAWKIGSKSWDPLKMYLSDLYTVPANLAGLPAISVPMGEINEDGENLPVGIQLMSKAWSEQKLFALAKVVEHLA